MCGRFTLSAQPALIAEVFGLTNVPDLAPRYNIAPTQRAAVVRQPTADEPRQLDMLRWGLVPAWADDPAIGNRLINARSETVGEKPAFRSAFRHRRCLVPADGFFEWAKSAGGKQPYHFHRADGAPFALAGLWERRQRGDEPALETFTILTTAANSVVRPLHDRMPVILQPGDYEAWLDPELDEAAHLTHLLSAAPEDFLVVNPVSPVVNSAGHDGPDCVAAVS
jgi:putative SOS response-associated peptidase YedK